MIFTLPFLTFFLILLGFSDPIGNWIHQLAFADSERFSSAAVTLFIIGFFMVAFQFFNMFVNSVYWYFFNDVIPQQYMGQFLGLFRVVGGLAGALFSKFIFPFAESHMSVIFLGAGLLYFFGFGAMCLKVKEGEYPPPPEYVENKQGFFAGIKTFFIECFSLKFYWFMFGMATFQAIAGSASFMTIFFQRDIGMNLEQIGLIGGVGGIVALCLTYPAGFIADKYHPLRVLFAARLLLLCLGPLSLAFVFFTMKPQTAYTYYFAISMLNLPASVLYGASLLPTEMRIFPKERFGQFCSAQAMIRSCGTILGGFLAGVVFDMVRNHYQGSDFAYRWLPLWSITFDTLSFICLINVYRGWKRYGGRDNYTPPLPEKKA